jgi:hypothetical protein
MDSIPRIIPPLGSNEAEILAALESLPAAPDMAAIMRAKRQEEFDSIPEKWNSFVESLPEVDGLPLANPPENNRIEIRRNARSYVVFELDHSLYPPIVVSGTLGEGRITVFDGKFTETLAYRFLNPDWNDPDQQE